MVNLTTQVAIVILLLGAWERLSVWEGRPAAGRQAERDRTGHQ